jgi:MSHA biogenesis protein MshK
MKESEQMIRILRARHVCVPLLALMAVAAASHADTLHDPTQPANVRSAPEASAGALKVEAIFLSGNRRVAIVNGQLVRQGESLGGAVIDEIHADSIRYTRDGASHVARLPKPGMLVRSGAGSGSGS